MDSISLLVISMEVSVNMCAAAEESENENSALVVGAVPHQMDQCQASVELYHPRILKELFGVVVESSVVIVLIYTRPGRSWRCSVHEGALALEEGRGGDGARCESSEQDGAGRHPMFSVPFMQKIC